MSPSACGLAVSWTNDRLSCDVALRVEIHPAGNGGECHNLKQGGGSAAKRVREINPQKRQRRRLELGAEQNRAARAVADGKLSRAAA